MLLRCCLTHISIIILRHFLYLLYLLLISYLCDLFFIFMFTFTDILLLLLIFQNMYYYFWIITGMKKNVNNFQTTKVQPQGVAQHLLDFCQFQPGVSYKSVAYKKSVYILLSQTVSYRKMLERNTYMEVYGRKCIFVIYTLIPTMNSSFVMNYQNKKQKKLKTHFPLRIFHNNAAHFHKSLRIIVYVTHYLFVFVEQ